MTVAQFAPMSAARGGSRWLLLGSLALNLFFVGIVAAMAVRAPAKSWWDPDVFVLSLDITKQTKLNPRRVIGGKREINAVACPGGSERI